MRRSTTRPRIRDFLETKRSLKTGVSGSGMGEHDDAGTGENDSSVIRR